MSYCTEKYWADGYCPNGYDEAYGGCCNAANDGNLTNAQTIWIAVGTILGFALVCAIILLIVRSVKRRNTATKAE